MICFCAEAIEKAYSGCADGLRDKMLARFGIVGERIVISALGKPRIENGGAYFSVSHSHGLCACAVSVPDAVEASEALPVMTDGMSAKVGGLYLVGSSGVDIGVDIELINPDSAKRQKKIATRFFTTDEAKYAAEHDCFFRIWTMKEAYSKLTGRGIGDFRNFSVLETRSAGFVTFTVSSGADLYAGAVCMSAE